MKKTDKEFPTYEWEGVRGAILERLEQRLKREFAGKLTQASDYLPWLENARRTIPANHATKVFDEPFTHQQYLKLTAYFEKESERAGNDLRRAPALRMLTSTLAEIHDQLYAASKTTDLSATTEAPKSKPVPTAEPVATTEAPARPRTPKATAIAPRPPVEPRAPVIPAAPKASDDFSAAWDALHQRCSRLDATELTAFIAPSAAQARAISPDAFARKMTEARAAAEWMGIQRQTDGELARLAQAHDQEHQARNAGGRAAG